MSFSYEVKEELVKHMGTARHCQLAELAAILHFCGQYGRDAEGAFTIGFQVENPIVVKKCFTLLKKTFSIDATVYSETFTHSKFVAYRVKDAIADFFMEKQGKNEQIKRLYL